MKNTSVAIESNDGERSYKAYISHVKSGWSRIYSARDERFLEIHTSDSTVLVVLYRTLLYPTCQHSSTVPLTAPAYSLHRHTIESSVSLTVFYTEDNNC
jgi:hypothetical protein